MSPIREPEPAAAPPPGEGPLPSDWRALMRDVPEVSVVDSRRRLRWMLAGFVLLVAAVEARLVWLETARGAAYRAHAARPIVRQLPLPAARGRILARGGVVLARDEPIAALAVDYRTLEEPPDAAWLRRQARRRLSGRARRDAERLRAEMAAVLAERNALHDRLARLNGLTRDAWNERCRAVQRRVERIHASVRARQLARHAAAHSESEEPTAGPWWERTWQLVKRALRDAPPPPAPLVVAEQEQYHTIVDRLDPELALAIEADADAYPGVELRRQTRRNYPQEDLAGPLVGHLGAADRDSADEAGSARVGRLGLERSLEPTLRGAPGEAQERTDRRGRILKRQVVRPPRPGRDVVLTLDVELQRAAERLLDDAQARRPTAAQLPAAGGAIVVLDCHTGAVRAAASAPRFDPGVVESGASEPIAALFAAADKPLLDRATRMALPPGGLLQLVTAIGLLEEGAIDAGVRFACPGTVDRSGRSGCRLERRLGGGHGPLALETALAHDCSLCLLEPAEQLGAGPLVTWSVRFGLGAATGLEVPSESPGRLPSHEELAAGWSAAQTRNLANGQGPVTVTPLQVARVVAAIANGGFLVLPHLRADAASSPRGRPRQIAGLEPSTLELLRAAMRRAVGDRRGALHVPLDDAPLPLAAQAGTARAGRGRPAHAWIAGFVPADAPHLALVVAIEHGGPAPETAGPVAVRLVEALERLGYCPAPRVAGRPAD